MQATTNVRSVRLPSLARGRRITTWVVAAMVVAPFAALATGWVVRGGAERIALGALAVYSVVFAARAVRSYGRLTTALVVGSGFALVSALVVLPTR